MNVKFFLDTNIFIYTQSSIDTKKRDICLNLMEKENCCASTQVLKEICNVLTNKFKIQGKE